MESNDKINDIKNIENQIAALKELGLFLKGMESPQSENLIAEFEAEMETIENLNEKIR